MGHEQDATGGRRATNQDRQEDQLILHEAHIYPLVYKHRNRSPVPFV
jgi:hypothetical protein